MEHQPYKTWILDDEDLSDDQNLRLNDHLAACPECAQLSENLNSALLAIRVAPEVAAPAGFTQRWSAALATRKREEEKQQARSLGIALGSSALVIAVGAMLIFIPGLSLISLTAGLITTVVNVLDGMQTAVSFATTLFKSISPATMVLLFSIAGGWLLLASFTLGLSVWKLAIKKVENK